MNNNLERERIRAALRSKPIPVTVPRLASELGVDIAVIEAFIQTNAGITTELQQGLAALLARTEQRNIPAPARTTERKNMHPTLNARTLKCVAVLDTKELAAYPYPPDNIQRIIFQIAVAGGRHLLADISAKSIRKCKKVINENGVENVAIIIQGRLTDGSYVVEPGLVAQVKLKAEQKEKENVSA